MWKIALLILILICAYFYFTKNINKCIQNKQVSAETFITKQQVTQPTEIKKTTVDNISNDKVFLDIKYGDEQQRIIIELFSKIVPRTTTNFKQLIKQKKYINSPFHRIIKGFMLQGGDFTNQDGTGGMSIYGKTFEDENFKIKHFPFCLSMANSGPDTNSSQFFITTVSTPHLDNKHVVFGKVISGINYIKKLENINTNHSNRPLNDVIIINSGII